MNKCDNCGKEIKGQKYQIVDENFKPQKGLFHCGCVYKTSLRRKIKCKSTNIKN